MKNPLNDRAENFTVQAKSTRPSVETRGKRAIQKSPLRQGVLIRWCAEKPRGDRQCSPQKSRTIDIRSLKETEGPGGGTKDEILSLPILEARRKR